MSLQPKTIAARWIVPISRPPIEGGSITLLGDRIISVNDPGAVSAQIDLEDVALIPGLVNAHTHLDLSGLHGRIPPQSDFVGWLRQVVACRRSQDPATIVADVRSGLQQALRWGTTLLGDIASFDTRSVLVSAPIRSLIFREILGLPASRVEPVWKNLMEWIQHYPDTETCRLGVSPHAPYSVHASLIRASAFGAWPVCLHLAESTEEQQLLETHTGPMVPFLQELGVWEEDGLAPSWDWIVWRTSRAPSVLYAHGNYLSENTALGPNASVVYCPRTHAAFGHPPHPFRSFLDRGIRVALGTDSLASNPDLDVLGEAAWLHQQYPELAGETLLRMATLSGAEALGFADDTGSLEAGKSADMVAISIPPTQDPYQAILEADRSLPRKVMFRGEWLRM